MHMTPGRTVIEREVVTRGTYGEFVLPRVGLRERHHRLDRWWTTDRSGGEDADEAGGNRGGDSPGLHEKHAGSFRQLAWAPP